MLKKSVSDFLCAFVLFTIVLLCIAAVADKGFSKDALVYDEAKGYVQLFGVRIERDAEAVGTIDELFRFNDKIFGRKFSAVVKKTGEFVMSYVRDFMIMAFATAQKLVGAG